MQGKNGITNQPYASESDIVFFVRQFLVDIMVALGLNFSFSSEITMSHIKPDIAVLLMGRYVVGVVEVKKPGNNILAQPTVLGELLDQMFLVEGFYMTGPVIGILTTGEEWVVSWFPGDTDTLTKKILLKRRIQRLSDQPQPSALSRMMLRDTVHQAGPHHSNLVQFT